MALSKAHRFPPLDFYLSILCKAFSHPARIVVFRHLCKHPDELISVHVLSRDIPLSPGTMSHHLDILRKLGIVDYLEDCPNMYYGLNTESQATCTALLRILESVHPQNLTAYVQEVPRIVLR